jgi:hypothetical protein
VAVTTTTLPSGTVSQAYAATLQASGGSGTYAWTVVNSALPAGLVLDASSGAIAGTPQQSGATTFTVRAADAGDASNAANQTLAITIAPPPPPPVVIGTASLPAGTVSVSYTATLSASGGTGAYNWSQVSGTLPAGLSLGASGVLAGTPSLAGTSTFTVRAADSTDGSNSAQQTFTLTIAPASIPSVVIVTTSLPDAVRGAAYSKTLAVSGGKAPFTWARISGTLPPGLTLNATTGTIAGVPTQAGTWNFTVRVTDSAVPATKSKRSFSLRVRRP